MKCREYIDLLINQGWKVASKKDNFITLQKDNQQKIINSLFDTSTKAAGLGESSNDPSIGTIVWANPTNIYLSDNVRASATFVGTAIKDVAVRIIKADASLGTEDKADTALSWPGSDTDKTYGGSSDLWSETWTPVDVNNANFGVALACKETGGVTSYWLKATHFGFSIPAKRTISGITVKIEREAVYSTYIYAMVDYVEITITYSPPLPPANLSLVPVNDGQNVVVRGQYNAVAGEQGTYVRIQISDTADFSHILNDTGQVAITPINDEDYYQRIVNWFPTSAGTYYYRMAFWNAGNYLDAPLWGSSSFIVNYPTITSIAYSNEKDMFTFLAIVTDYYTKPPIVTLNVDNDTDVMDYVNRTGTGPYAYTFSKIVRLERGDYEYFVKIGNVWTTIIGDIRYLHADYNLNEEPKIEVFLGNEKINSWNHLLTENVLPDFPELEFDTNEKIEAFDVITKFTKNDFKQYNMEIKGQSKITEGYHIRTKEIANRDLEQTVSFASQAINSLSLLKSLLPQYIFGGTLAETIYLQSFLDERVIDILKRILILNNAIGYVRNKKIYLYDLSNVNALFKMNVVDAQIGYESDPSVIVNKVREYYIRMMYPVPNNIFTNYDASNWLGTATDVRQTGNGVLPESGNLYCLKGNGTIYRTLDFLWSDFDQLNMKWSPDVATSLEIRLETDAANYRKYTRAYSGQKGAGFVLTGNLVTDIVTKTITFADKYIHTVQGNMSQACSFKIELKLDGNIVATSDWLTTTGIFGYAFNNVLCDTILLSFTNLYPVGTSYGVNCLNLSIEEYKKIYQVTDIRQSQNWHERYTGSMGLSWVKNGLVYTGTATTTFGSAPSLGGDESYSVQVNKCTSYASKATPAPGGGYTWKNFTISASLGVGVNSKGIIEASFGCSFVLDYEGQPFAIPAFSYSFDIYRILTVYTGVWVWIYETYVWQSTYNLWDDISIPFSQFTAVGTPTNQINTIRLIATTNNYYDTIYFIKNIPVPKYVEAENVESSARGIKFQERKTDGWSSKESALAFAKAFVNLFGDPAESYSKKMSMKTDINIGDMVDCDGTILPVYKISYDLKTGQMTVFVGRSVTDTLEFLKETSRKIEAIEKTIY